MELLKSALIVGLGSFCGGGLRFLTVVWVERKSEGAFPISILLVNLIGSFVIGFAVPLFLRLGMGRESGVPLFLSVGLLGGYTTFSTFSLQTLRLLEGGELGLAALNAVVSVLGCLVAVYLGVKLGQSAFG